MDRLWSPWRLAYVTGTTTTAQCVFCQAAEAGPERAAPEAAPDDLVLVRGECSFVILNLYPYNNGHLLVVPTRHVGSLAAATKAELAELMWFIRCRECPRP